MKIILTLLILVMVAVQQNHCVPIALATSGQFEAKGEIELPLEAVRGGRFKRARHTKCWLYCRNSNPSSCEQRCNVPVGDRNPSEDFLVEHCVVFLNGNKGSCKPFTP